MTKITWWFQSSVKFGTNIDGKLQTYPIILIMWFKILKTAMGGLKMILNWVFLLSTVKCLHRKSWYWEKFQYGNQKWEILILNQKVECKTIKLKKYGSCITSYVEIAYMIAWIIVPNIMLSLGNLKTWGTVFFLW